MHRFIPLTCAVLLGLGVAVGPAARAQVSAGLGVSYLDYDSIGRWGVSGGLYIPVAGYAFDIVPNATYNYSKWSVGSDAPQRDVYALALDAHLNLPQVALRVRPYVMTGVAFVGAGGDTGFGLDLGTGLYVRATGWRAFPFAQITYRVLPEFETQPPWTRTPCRGASGCGFSLWTAEAAGTLPTVLPPPRTWHCAAFPSPRPMHILYVYQFYNSPDCCTTAKHYWFIRHFVEQGHTVSLVTSDHFRDQRITDEFVAPRRRRGDPPAHPLRQCDGRVRAAPSPSGSTPARPWRRACGCPSPMSSSASRRRSRRPGWPGRSPA